MTVPTEFREFTCLFLQGSHEWASDEKSWINQAVRLLDKEKRPIVRRYVEELLASNRDEGELGEVWNSCSPNYAISEGDIRSFLSAVRESLLQLES